MPNLYFKYKALSLTPEGELDSRSLKQVIEPIVESYYFLPTREKLNDPNEGIFQNQVQEGIAAFLQGITALGEKFELTKALLDMAKHISQATDDSGVFSLSSTATDELMWAHYASSHCGIAIEYDLEQLTRFSSQQHLHCFGVAYVNEPPLLDMQSMQEDTSKAVRTMLGHKSPRWSYEEEFRVVVENSHGILPHDYRAVKSITFGLSVSDKTRDCIYESTKHKVEKYYEIRKVPESYLLERRLLENFLGEQPTGSSADVDWKMHFEKIHGAEKERMIHIAQSEIESDPHFIELLLADRSPTYPSKAVIQYEAHHHLGLKPWSKYTKNYYDLSEQI